MADVMPIEDIRDLFRDEWVLLEDPQTNEFLAIQGGKVLCHSKDRDEVHRQLVALRPGRFAIVSTGRIPEGTAILI
jgi:hypothetical protein